MVLIMLITVFSALIDAEPALARVTQAHIDRLKQDRRNIQTRMQNVQNQIDALEFDMLTETAKRNVYLHTFIEMAGKNGVSIYIEKK